MERTKRGLEDAHRRESSQAAKEYEDEKNRLLTEQKKTNEEIEWKTAQMNRLGIFKRAEKKALCALRDQYQSQIDRLRERYEKEKAAISE